jgi:Cys-rich four helix bundle protein (predicted Tat secretion target)
MTIEKDLQESAPSRRNILLGAGIAASSLALGGAALAAKKGSHDMGHMDHGGKYGDLAHAALMGMMTGEACIRHCLSQFKAGDTSLAECADAVEQMIAMSDATFRLASLDSPHIVIVAQACMEVCASCEKECLKHADHAQCKTSAAACADCIAECKKIIG